MVRQSPTLITTVLVFLKVVSRRRATIESVALVSSTARKTCFPISHEDPEKQVLLFGAAPLLLSRELDIPPCSHEGLGHPGQSPLPGVIPLRGGVVPLWALLGVTLGKEREK